VEFLRATQRADGAWLPLWFGHQESPDDENPLYGTARVLSALAPLRRAGIADVSPWMERAVDWVVNWQNADGGWAGARGAKSSVEETALAVAALTDAVQEEGSARAREASRRGLTWLIERVESGGWREPSPIGFYFARLWYFEKLYPMIFTASALHHAASCAGEARDAGPTI
jgi:squalene-hopene/tetraprenyl-beta-curcumene cyclase